MTAFAALQQDGFAGWPSHPLGPRGIPPRGLPLVALVTGGLRRSEFRRACLYSFLRRPSCC